MRVRVDVMKIIAEMCQNHNGSFSRLCEMVQESKKGGATHAKIQTIFANDLSYRKEFENGLKDENGKFIYIKRPYSNEYERLKKLELTYENQKKFVEVCLDNELIPLTTSFNLTAIPNIKKSGFKSIKVASYDCASVPLIKKLVNNFDEVIVSTGATYDDEIVSCAEILKESKKDFSLLHCVTKYPTPLKEMNLNRINFLRKYSEKVGLSNHSLTKRDGVKADIAAIYLGADCIERHFTILGENETKDGPVSIRREHLEEINSFINMNEREKDSYIDNNIPEFEQMKGSSLRDLSDEELANRNYYRGRFCNKIKGKSVFNWEKEANEI